MSSCHYTYIKVAYGSQAKMLITNTDSFSNVIKSENVYEDF